MFVHPLSLVGAGAESSANQDGFFLFIDFAGSGYKNCCCAGTEWLVCLKHEEKFCIFPLILNMKL